MENNISRKCVVKIRGGLGNQLFQYAFAYCLSSKFGIHQIEMDVRSYKHYHCPFLLNQFQLSPVEVTSNKSQKYDFDVFFYRFYEKIYKFFKGDFPNFYSNRKLKKGELFCRRFCDFPTNLYTNDIYMFGYFQNAEILCSCRGRFNGMFTLKNLSDKVQKTIKQIQPHSIAVSIRLLDSNKSDKKAKFKYWGKEEYVNAVKKIIAKRGYKNNVQLIISSNKIDTIINEKWFDEFENTLYLQSFDAPELLEIMKRCRDFVISNSTFAWWVGYLGSYNKDSLVVAPKYWYQNSPIEETKLFFKEMVFLD